MTNENITVPRELLRQVLDALEKIHNHPKSFWNCLDEITAIRAALEQPVQEPVALGDWQLVPIEPTQEMISAMAISKAVDDEGEFPMLMDMIDYSGENKTRTVLIAAHKAMLSAAPQAQQPAVDDDDDQYECPVCGELDPSTSCGSPNCGLIAPQAQQEKRNEIA